jgi:hypothetical protein
MSGIRKKGKLFKSKTYKLPFVNVMYNLDVSTDGWEMNTASEFRHVWFYVGSSMPLERDVFVVNLIVLWFSFSVGWSAEKRTTQ